MIKYKQKYYNIQGNSMKKKILIRLLCGTLVTSTLIFNPVTSHQIVSEAHSGRTDLRAVIVTTRIRVD